MKLDKENVIYGGIAGALVGVAFIFAKGWWSSDYSDVHASNLVLYAVCGAVGGIAAFALRASAGDDGK